MKINFNKFREIEWELRDNGIKESQSYYLLTEFLREYLYREPNGENLEKLEMIKDVLIREEILVPEDKDNTIPFVKPHNFTNNG